MGLGIGGLATFYVSLPIAERSLQICFFLSFSLSLSPPIDKVARFKVTGDKTKIKARFVFEIGYCHRNCRLRFDYSITFFAVR